MTSLNESREYISNMVVKGDADQLIPVSHLTTILNELVRLETRIATQAELLAIYRNQLAQAQA